MYFQMLRDPSVPTHRVVRKTAGLCLIAIAWIFYYRHVERNFGLGEPALVTLGLAVGVFVVVGLLGGVLAGSLYESFLRGVGAQCCDLTPVVFFAEWLFAACSPLLGAIAFGVIGSILDAAWL